VDKAEPAVVLHPFRCEYPDRESADEWPRRAEAHPYLDLAAFAGDAPAGIRCRIPSPRRDGAADLQGIAFNPGAIRTPCARPRPSFRVPKPAGCASGHQVRPRRSFIIAEADTMG
jgi:hypothetical protein